MPLVLYKQISINSLKKKKQKTKKDRFLLMYKKSYDYACKLEFEFELRF